MKHFDSDADRGSHTMMPNGSVPTALNPDTNDEPMAVYDLLIELDRLEELIEMMDDLGVSTRAELEALPQGPDSVQLLHELNTLRLQSRDDIEARIAELEAGLADDV